MVGLSKDKKKHGGGGDARTDAKTDDGLNHKKVIIKNLPKKWKV